MEPPKSNRDQCPGRGGDLDPKPTKNQKWYFWHQRVEGAHQNHRLPCTWRNKDLRAPLTSTRSRPRLPKVMFGCRQRQRGDFVLVLEGVRGGAEGVWRSREGCGGCLRVVQGVWNVGGSPTAVGG